MTVMTYEITEPDGTQRQLTTSGPLSLAAMQAIVGGDIELIRQGEQTFCVNEDGRLERLRVNAVYPAFVGTVIRGRMRVRDADDGECFVGYLQRAATPRELRA